MIQFKSMNYRSYCVDSCADGNARGDGDMGKNENKICCTCFFIEIYTLKSFYAEPANARQQLLIA